MVELLWLGGAQVLAAGWAASSSRAHGVQLLAPVLDRHLPRGRADTLSGLGRARTPQPHELWLLGLVLALGLAAPGLATYIARPVWPLAALIAGGVVLTSVGTRARRWPRTERARRTLARLTSLAALVTLAATGYTGALLITGAAVGLANGEPFTPGIGWFAALCAGSWVALGAARAASSIAGRQVGAVAARARGARPPLLGLATGLVGATLMLGIIAHQLSPVLHHLVIWGGGALVLAALVGAVVSSWVRQGRWVAVWLATAAGVSPLLLGAGAYPFILVSRHRESSVRVAAVLAEHPALAQVTAMVMATASLVMIWRGWTLAEGGLGHLIKRQRLWAQHRAHRHTGQPGGTSIAVNRRRHP